MRQWCGLLLLGGLLASLASPFACAAPALRVNYVISRQIKDMFYGPDVAFMQAAARDLGVVLDVIEPMDDHFKAVRLVERALRSKPPPDAMIVVSVKGTGDQIVKLCEEAEVPMLVENAAILNPKVGAPRQKYRQYIGEMLPADEMAGYELAKYLIRRASANTRGKIQILAISGPEQTSASQMREKGLHRALAESPHAELKQLVRADWRQELAHDMFKGLKMRYKDVSVVWTASDGMALGVSDAAREMGLTPGSNLQIGGVDWSAPGIAGLKAGRIQATAGGQFMEGAWSLIAMYDYLNGKDFAKSEGLNMRTEMRLLTAENLSEYASLLEPGNWERINFKAFSKLHNPGMKRYDFSLQNVQRNLRRRGKQAPG